MIVGVAGLRATVTHGTQLNPGQLQVGPGGDCGNSELDCGGMPGATRALS